RLLSFTDLINQMGQHAGTVVSVDAIGKGCRQHGTPLAYLFNQPGSAGTIDAAETEDTVWKAAGTNQRFGFQQAFAAEARRLRWRVFIYPAAILLPVDTGAGDKRKQSRRLPMGFQAVDQRCAGIHVSTAVALIAALCRGHGDHDDFSRFGQELMECAGFTEIAAAVMNERVVWDG